MINSAIAPRSAEDSVIEYWESPIPLHCSKYFYKGEFCLREKALAHESAALLTVKHNAGRRFFDLEIEDRRCGVCKLQRIVGSE